MGFFSFGKKKKNDTKPTPAPAVPAKSHLRRPSNIVNSASASSSISAATSSGSSSGSPPQPRRTQTFSGAQTNQRLSFSPDTHLHPVPRIPGSHSHASSSSSLNAPIAPYANRDLQKKGSTNTLNSIKSTASKRGAHEAPRINPELAALGLAKPRASSYHASQVRNIWVTSASDAGHGSSKYYSTGSPGVMNRGSSYFGGQAQAQHPPQSDEQFKIYAKKYDTAIAKAHTLAREYHHLPPAKRDRSRFEHIGRSFAAASQLSREQWSYRCKLEKERLEALLDQGQLMPQQDEGELSTHRIAGARATEGWQYASMLADAWGIKDEVEPLEDMPVLKPVYPTARSSSFYSDRNGGPSYLHPGYSQANYTTYASPGPTRRDRMDSNASAALSLADSQHHSTSSHTHSGFSHSLNHSQSHHTLSKSNYLSSPLKSNSGVEETVTRAPIVLTKGRKYRERGNSLASVPVTVS